MAKIYKTKNINNKVNKPHIIAMMFDKYLGVSLDGGAMAKGVNLTFGKPPSPTAFYPNDWIEISLEEYKNLAENK